MINLYQYALGGNKGFDKVVWEVVERKEGECPSITFKYQSHDGEEGLILLLTLYLLFLTLCFVLV